MRLFTALDLPADVVSRLEELLRELKPVARLKWSPPKNLHITTKFIGDWPADRLDELRERMPTDVPAPEVSIRATGFFPNDRYPKVFFARVEPSVELLRLATATDAAMGELGVPLEKHPYRPHVTLARIPASIHLHPLRDRLGELAPGLFGAFRAPEYSLFESRAGQYTKLVTFPLEAGSR